MDKSILMEKIYALLMSNGFWMRFALGIFVVEILIFIYRKSFVKVGPEIFANVSSIPGRLLAKKLHKPVFGALFGALPKLTHVRFESHLWYWLLAMLSVDFAYYWAHRACHKFPLLWAVHGVHHSGQEYNISLAYRLSWFQLAMTLLYVWPAIVMLLIGFPPYIVYAGFALPNAYQSWLHTKLIGRIPVFEALFVTPGSHHLHHAYNECYVNRNFGAMFSLWDRIFKTHVVLGEEPRIGLKTQLNTYNIFKIQFAGIATLIRSWLIRFDSDRVLGGEPTTAEGDLLFKYRRSRP